MSLSSGERQQVTEFSRVDKYFSRQHLRLSAICLRDSDGSYSITVDISRCGDGMVKNCQLSRAYKWFEPIFQNL